MFYKQLQLDLYKIGLISRFGLILHINITQTTNITLINTLTLVYDTGTNLYKKLSMTIKEYILKENRGEY